MSSTSPGAFAPDPPDAVRPLPPRPSLEYERKQAKRLLAQLKRGDPESLQRARRHLKRAESTELSAFKLADAQFTIAREYGFQSWPRLVEYFETLVRHERSGAPEFYIDPRSLESWPKTMLAEHRQHRAWATRTFMAFVPRLYGLSYEQASATEVTLDEARLAYARQNLFPNWDAMVAAVQVPPRDEWQRDNSPLKLALAAIRAQDASAFAEVIEAHPSLLTDEVPNSQGYLGLVRNAVIGAVRSEDPQARAIVTWLAARVDIQSSLNWMLLGGIRTPTSMVELLLELGADPSWMPPNGISVLEHAIVRYWNGEAVDRIAERVTPPRAFWVAAGLGDVAAVRRYLSRDGHPTAAARAKRPDFMATARGLLSATADADPQLVVWEAFLVAAFNQRFAVLDVLLDRGFPVDYNAWGQTVLHLAVGNGWVPLIEYLVRRGADVDFKGWRPNMSAREMAEEGYLNPHGHPDKLRILQLCGGRDPEVLERYREQQRAGRVMPTHPALEEAFAFAKTDAARQGLTAVTPENLFIALLYQGRLTLEILSRAGVDLARLKEQVAPRLLKADQPADPEMTAGPDATSVLLEARAEAERRKHEHVTTLHVFHGLLQKVPAAVGLVIEPAGGSVERLRAEFERMLSTW